MSSSMDANLITVMDGLVLRKKHWVQTYKQRGSPAHPRFFRDIQAESFRIPAGKTQTLIFVAMAKHIVSVALFLSCMGSSTAFQSLLTPMLRGGITRNTALSSLTMSDYLSNLGPGGPASVSPPSGFSPSGGMMGAPTGGRKYFIAGNWKMNPETLDEAKSLAYEVVQCASRAQRDMDICVCCPYPFLATVADITRGSRVSVGAEDVFTEDKGAFTGGVSVSQVKSVGCKYVVIGHSERRHGNIASESDAVFNLKTRKVLDAGLEPILCVGETKDEYEANLNKAVCALQLSKGLAGVSAAEMSRVTIAYEPVWAIGTGLTATPEIAQEVHAFIRQHLAEMYGPQVAASVRIQYGGSVAPGNVDALMACPDIDGALVGGASLVAEQFDKIINFN